MKLWRIWQTVNQDYDTFDSAVVAAETEQAARETYPGWHAPDGWPEVSDDSWAPVERVDAVEIGNALEGTKAGVICASFNAG